MLASDYDPSFGSRSLLAFHSMQISNYLSWLTPLIPISLSLLAAGSWVLTLLGLPGNWGLLGIAVLTAYFTPQATYFDVSSTTVLLTLGLASAGEVVEFIAGAAGVNQLGGSRKGSVLALSGSVVGAIVGIFVGVPVPIVGSLIAAVLFGGLGAFAGAVAGERWDGKDWNLAMKIGWGALFGKLLGTLLKSICGTVMLVLLLVSFWY
jgi:uncharacterized protein YqgC (DUF456 family)